MATTTKKTTSSTASTKKVTKSKSQNLATGSESNPEVVEAPVETVEVAPISFTEEQIADQKATLEEGIAKGIEWFEFGQVEEQYNGMSEKEQTFTRLIDPMVWLMREALITYQEREEGCEECKVRVESGGNGLAVAIAEMMLGRL